MKAPTTKSGTPYEDADNQVRIVGWDGVCPHCGKDVRFEIRTDFGTFIDPGDKEQRHLRDMDSKDRELIVLAESTGVLASFENAAKQQPGKPPVTAVSIRRRFVRFLQRATQTKISPAMRLALQATFTESGTYRFVVLTCGDISAVFANEVLRFFVPTVFLHNDRPALEVVAGVNGKPQLKMADLVKSIHPLDAWVKTKMGYVPIEGKMFLREVRKRNYGAFANISW